MPYGSMKYHWLSAGSRWQKKMCRCVFGLVRGPWVQWQPPGPVQPAQARWSPALTVLFRSFGSIFWASVPQNAASGLRSDFFCFAPVEFRYFL